MTWLIIFLLVVVIGYYISRMAKDQEEGARHDTGLAILEFGRAFPNEAIRSLHETADGSAIFVRLHDNKAGIMRNHRAHYACHLIEPGRVRVQPLPNGRSFSAEFLDSPTQNGNFVFSSEQEAAEVLLWLLGNYVPAHETDAHSKAHPHPESGHSSV
ncbi:hypothetical protein [Rhizobium oryzicola]|uniref:Uncharacterized protein n=1 Tax=Rhizobium oryzicola TaxID=1232668 RepID=A0ABT8T3G7_9HYPH|nr:hypothetical protein [Rhizobium oryzicola]MDO1585115.1 hypothetical protein [Rhizobium oryzicola]